ncbi:MAG: hypothetical protein M3M89_04605 [Thermoproteota archaeon]|nr:hypothetical protein [Thermoproteota archaeon]
MDFPRFIHIYQRTTSAPAAFGAKVVAEEIDKIFPSCKIDIRPPFKYEEKMIEHAKIADVKQPLEKQPNHEQYSKMMTTTTTIPLYDGFVMQKKLAEMIPTAEISLAHIHIIFTSLLTCTFSEDDWRYHGRAVICGTPSIVSTTGIVEALAKPREFYLAQLLGGIAEDINMLKKKFAGRFIDYDDEDKITAASINYALQAIFFFITSGDPFCNNKDCRLFNAHWQEDLIHTIEKRTLCSHHENLANR